jgi:hypothetical protein
MELFGKLRSLPAAKPIISLSALLVVASGCSTTVRPPGGDTKTISGLALAWDVVRPPPILPPDRNPAKHPHASLHRDAARISLETALPFIPQAGQPTPYRTPVVSNGTYELPPNSSVIASAKNGKPVTIVIGGSSNAPAVPAAEMQPTPLNAHTKVYKIGVVPEQFRTLAGVSSDVPFYTINTTFSSTEIYKLDPKKSYLFLKVYCENVNGVPQNSVLALPLENAIVEREIHSSMNRGNAEPPKTPNSQYRVTYAKFDYMFEIGRPVICVDQIRLGFSAMQVCAPSTRVDLFTEAIPTRHIGYGPNPANASASPELARILYSGK